MISRDVEGITVRQRLTPLGIACRPGSDHCCCRMIYVQYSMIHGRSSYDDGPVTDSSGRPILVAPELPIETIWDYAGDQYLQHRGQLGASKKALLPVGDMIGMARRGYGEDEYDWIIFSLNLMFECLYHAGIPLAKQIVDVFWTMHDYFTFEHDVEKFLNERAVSGDQAASVLEWGLNTVRDNACFLRA